MQTSSKWEPDNGGSLTTAQQREGDDKLSYIKRIGPRKVLDTGC